LDADGSIGLTDDGRYIDNQNPNVRLTGGGKFATDSAATADGRTGKN
jgi:hypothetical protein